MQGCKGRFALFFVLFPLFAFPSQLLEAKAAGPTPPIPRFLAFEPGLYRGGRPGHEGLLYLKSLGVRTVVNLENSASAVADETRFAQSLGMRVISLPMSDIWFVDGRTVDRALAAVADPSLRPLFVHCHHGEDRTGLIFGLHRVEQEHWAPRAAYQEMLRLGFHKIMIFLNHYYEERTGFED